MLKTDFTFMHAPRHAGGHYVRSVNHYATQQSGPGTPSTPGLAAYRCDAHSVAVISPGYGLPPHSAGGSLLSSSSSSSSYPLVTAAGPLTVLSLYPLHPTAVCLHPTRPVVAIGTEEGWAIVVEVSTAPQNNNTNNAASSSSSSSSHLLPLSALLAQGSTVLCRGGSAHRSSVAIGIKSEGGAPTSSAGVTVAALALGSASSPSQPIVGLTFSIADDASCLLVGLTDANTSTSGANRGGAAMCAWHLTTSPDSSSACASFPFMDAEAIGIPADATEELTRIGAPRHVTASSSGCGELAVCGARNAAFVTVKRTADPNRRRGHQTSHHGTDPNAYVSRAWDVDVWRMQPLPADATTKNASASAPPPEFVAVAVPDKASREGKADTWVFAIMSSGLLVCFSATSGGASKWVDCRFAAVGLGPSSSSAGGAGSSTTSSTAMASSSSLPLTAFSAIGIQCTLDHVFVLGANVARCFTLGKWEIIDSLKVSDAIAAPVSSTNAFMGGLLLGGAASLITFGVSASSAASSCASSPYNRCALDDAVLVGTSVSMCTVVIPLASSESLAAAAAAKAEGLKTKIRFFLVGKARPIAVPFPRFTPPLPSSSPQPHHSNSMMANQSASGGIMQFAGPAPDRMPMVYWGPHCGVRLANDRSMWAVGECPFTASNSSAATIYNTVVAVAYHPLLDMVLVLRGSARQLSVGAYSYDSSKAFKEAVADEGSVAVPSLPTPRHSFDLARCTIAARPDAAIRPDSTFTVIVTMVSSDGGALRADDCTMALYTFNALFGDAAEGGQWGGSRSSGPNSGGSLSISLGSSQSIPSTPIATSPMPRAVMSSGASPLFHLRFVGDEPCLVLPTGVICSLQSGGAADDDDIMRFGAYHRSWQPATQHVCAVGGSAHRLVIATSHPCAVYTCDVSTRRLFPLQTRETHSGGAGAGAGGDDPALFVGGTSDAADDGSSAKETRYEAVAVDSRLSYVAVMARTSVLCFGGPSSMGGTSSRTEWWLVVCSTSAMKELCRVMVSCAEDSDDDAGADGHERGASSAYSSSEVNPSSVAFGATDDNAIIVMVNGSILRYKLDELVRSATIAHNTLIMPGGSGTAVSYSPLPVALGTAVAAEEEAAAESLRRAKRAQQEEAAAAEEEARRLREEAAAADKAEEEARRSAMLPPKSTSNPSVVVPPIDLSGRPAAGGTRAGGARTPTSTSRAVSAGPRGSGMPPLATPKTARERVATKSPTLSTRAGVERRPMTARSQTGGRAASANGGGQSPRPSTASGATPSRTMTPLQRQQQERAALGRAAPTNHRQTPTTASSSSSAPLGAGVGASQSLEEKMAMLEAFQRESNQRAAVGMGRLGGGVSSGGPHSPTSLHPTASSHHTDPYAALLPQQQGPEPSAPRSASLGGNDTVVVVAPTSHVGAQWGGDGCIADLHFAEVMTNVTDDSPVQSRQRELSTMLRDHERGLIPPSSPPSCSSAPAPTHDGGRLSEERADADEQRCTGSGGRAVPLISPDVSSPQPRRVHGGTDDDSSDLAARPPNTTHFSATTDVIAGHFKKHHHHDDGSDANEWLHRANGRPDEEVGSGGGAAMTGSRNADGGFDNIPTISSVATTTPNAAASSRHHAHVPQQHGAVPLQGALQERDDGDTGHGDASSDDAGDRPLTLAEMRLKMAAKRNAHSAATSNNTSSTVVEHASHATSAAEVSHRHHHVDPLYIADEDDRPSHPLPNRYGDPHHGLDTVHADHHHAHEGPREPSTPPRRHGGGGDDSSMANGSGADHSPPLVSNSPVVAGRRDRDAATTGTAPSGRRSAALVTGSLVNVSQSSDDEEAMGDFKRDHRPSGAGGGDNHSSKGALLGTASSTASSAYDPVKMRRLDLITARRSAAIQSVLAILKSMEPESREYEQLRREVGASSIESAPSSIMAGGEEEAERSIETWSEINRLLHEELRRETMQQ